MRRLHFIQAGLLTVLILSSYRTAAQQIVIGSLDEAMKLALEQNLDYQNYLLNQEKAGIEYKQSRNYRLPTVSGVFSGQRNIDLPTTPIPGELVMQPGTTFNAQFGQEYNYNAGISIQKDLFNQEKKLQSRISKLNQEVQEVSRKVFEELLKEQITLYYYTSLVASRAIEIGEKDLENSLVVESLTKEKYDQGLVDAITFNSSRINTNTVRQNLNANRQLTHQCHTELKKLMGLNLADTLVLNKSFDYFLPQTYSFDNLGRSENIESSELQLQQAEIGIKKSQASLFPTLSLNSYYGSQQFRNDFGLSLDSDSWTGNSYVSLNLTVPIFTGFNSRRNIHRSKLDNQVAFNKKQRELNYEKLEDQRLLTDYRISLEDTKSAQDTYELYEENQKLTFEKYEQGLISLDQYLKVFEEYIKAENAYLNSLTRVYTYYSQILPRVQ